MGSHRTVGTNHARGLGRPRLLAWLAGAFACAPVMRPALSHETLHARGAVRVDPAETRECVRLGGRHDVPLDGPVEDPELSSNGGNGPAALVIGGGAASAALGLAAFVPERRAVVFPHERNLLAPIVSGEDPEGLYPTFVFRMLTTPEPSHGDTQREEILEDWARILDEEIAPEQQALAERVLYGDGGLYDERLVDVRERMFDVLESHVNAVDRELELLYRYSARLVEASTAEARSVR